jgi:hypothetical protein
MFERLAEIFPALAFHCECIECMDEFMGYGWFNIPDGGEEFAFYDVPEDYWTTRGVKRDPIPHAKHRALMRKLVRAAQRTSGE